MRNLLQGYNHRDFEAGFVDHLYADFSEAVAEELAAQKMDSERSPSPLYEDIEVNAYPNPFRGSTMIEFTVDTPSNVELIVYDLLGREVTQLVRAPLSEGHYNFTFDAANLAQGFYFYRLRAGNKMKTGKLIYTK